MRITHDLMARVWVTPADGDSSVRWKSRVVIGTDDGRTFAAIVDQQGVGETVEVAALIGRWLETTDGTEWRWAPTSGAQSALAAAYALAPAAKLADVIALEPDDLAGELDSFTVPELRKLATAAGHEAVSALRKAELIALLSDTRTA